MEKEKIENKEEVKFIKEIQIKEFWNDKNVNIHWKLNSDVNILAGDNGDGKSTILELVIGTIRQEFKRPFLYNLYDGVIVCFNKPLQHPTFSVTQNVSIAANKKSALEIIEGGNYFSKLGKDTETIIIEEIKRTSKGIFINNDNICIPDLLDNKKPPIYKNRRNKNSRLFTSR